MTSAQSGIVMALRLAAATMAIALDPSALTLDGKQGSRTIRADDVGLTRERVRDSLLNGTLIGFGAGVVAGAYASSTIAEGGSGSAAFSLAIGGIGAGLGALVDRVIPGEKRDVYRAPTAVPAFRFSVAPVVTARTKGVRVSCSF